MTRLPVANRLGEDGGTTDGDVAARGFDLDSGLHERLAGVELHRLLEFSIRQIRQSELLAAQPRKSLDVAVPGRDVLVPDRPIDAVAVAQVRLEVEITPSIGLASPDQGAPAH